MAERAEHDFLSEYHAAMRRGGSPFAFLLTFSVVVFVVAFILWGRSAVLNEVTRGEARVVPSSKVQIIENLEGGILSEMLVREGQIVEKNDVLFKISNSTAQAGFRDSHIRSLELRASIARLEAESTGKPLVMPKEIEAEAPDIATNEQKLYESRAQQLKSAIAVLTEQVTQHNQEIIEARSHQETLSHALELARKEKAMIDPLVESGAAPQAETLRIDRQLADLGGQVTAVKLSIPRAEAAREEAKQRIAERQATFRTEASISLSKDRSELAATSEKVTADRDRVSRTEVRSPVRGTIKEIKVNTLGGVIHPGEDVIEIVPLEDTLLVEAKVRPSDIAFLRPGQAATVKISAYDYSIYGGLKARLEQISADTIKEERGETFFRVTLRTEKNHLGSDDHPLPIIPGMTATAEVETGKKTVLDYLLKPILKARAGAMHER